MGRISGCLRAVRLPCIYNADSDLHLTPQQSRSSRRCESPRFLSRNFSLCVPERVDTIITCGIRTVVVFPYFWGRTPPVANALHPPPPPFSHRLLPSTTPPPPPPPQSHSPERVNNSWCAVSVGADDPSPPVWPGRFHATMSQNRDGDLGIVDLWCVRTPPAAC